MAAIESNLMLTSDTASALAALGWRARVAAVHSGGIADVAAERTWSRGELSARVRLIVRCDAREERLVLASLDAPPIADRLPCYAFGDDDPAQRRALLDALGPAVVERLHKAAYPREIAAMERACIDALPARARASAIRDALLDDAFASIDAVRRDLFEHDLDVVLDDLDLDRDAAAETALSAAARCDLLQPIVVTTAEIWSMPERRRHDWNRVERRSLVGHDRRWIDIVHAGAFAGYAEALTRHIANAYAKRRFVSERDTLPASSPRPASSTRGARTRRSTPAAPRR